VLAMQWTIGQLDKIKATDMSDIEAAFPLLGFLKDAMMTVGIVFVLLFVAWTVYRNIWAPLDNKTLEEPYLMVIRALAGFGGVMLSYKILDMIFFTNTKLYAVVARAINAYNRSQAQAPQATIAEVVEKVIAHAVIGSIAVTSLIALVILIFFMTNLLKMVFEYIERCVIVAVLYFTAPLAFSTSSVVSMSSIFNSWCRHLGGHLLLLILDIWSINIIADALNNLTAATMDEFVIKFLYIICFLKVAQNFDGMLQKIGINVASTGGSLMDEILACSKAINLGGSSSGGNVARAATSASGIAPGDIPTGNAFASALKNIASSKTANQAALGAMYNAKGGNSVLNGNMSETVAGKAVSKVGGAVEKAVKGAGHVAAGVAASQFKNSIVGRTANGISKISEAIGSTYGESGISGVTESNLASNIKDAYDNSNEYGDSYVSFSEPISIDLGNAFGGTELQGITGFRADSATYNDSDGYIAYTGTAVNSAGEAVTEKAQLKMYDISKYGTPDNRSGYTVASTSDGAKCYAGIDGIIKTKNGLQTHSVKDLTNDMRKARAASQKM